MSISVSELTTLEKLKRKAFNHPLVAILVIATLGFIAIGQVAEAAVRLITPFRADALELATESAKGDYSRRLTHAAYNRLVWADSYEGRMRRGAKAADLDLAWNHYMDAVVDWSAELVNNRTLLEKYYGKGKTEEFNECIDPSMKAVHSAMLSLRYASAADTVTSDSLLATASFVIGDAMALVHSFSTGIQGRRPQRGAAAVRDSQYMAQCRSVLHEG